MDSRQPNSNNNNNSNGGDVIEKGRDESASDIHEMMAMSEQSASCERSHSQINLSGTGDDIDAEELATMVADKDLDTLRKLGGTDGLLAHIKVDPEVGILPVSEDEINQQASQGSGTAGSSEQELRMNQAKDLAANQEASDLSWIANFEEDTKLYRDRVVKYGVNVLPPIKSRSFLGLVWDALHDKMLILLIVAAIVSLGIGIYQDVHNTGDPIEDKNVHWVEGFAIIVAISVVTLVASINDYQKEKQFRKLNAKKNDRQVRVTRSGQERLVSTNCIMVGDILHIEPGDILCADAVVISSSNLKCDESSVTGESDALKKRRLEDAEKAYVERKKARQRRRAELRNKRREQRNRIAYTDDKIENSGAVDPTESGADADYSTDDDVAATVAKKTVHDYVTAAPDTTEAPPVQLKAAANSNKGIDPFVISGSRVTEGIGRCVIVAVGEQSFYGRTLMSLRSGSESTPLQIKLDGLAGLIAKLGGAAGLLMFIVLIIKYFVEFGGLDVKPKATIIVNDVVRIVISAVTVIVVAVPEGLPLAVTLALAVATTRMLKDNCLVRVLASCETMGNATTICSDKTGTLTQNRMTVVAGCIGDQYQFSSYPPGESAMQRRRAKQPPADGLVTDMTGRAVAPDKAVMPTLLQNETIRQKRLRTRRHRHQRRRMHRENSAYSSSSALTPLSDASPSISAASGSELSDYFSEEEELIIPISELREEAPKAVLDLCHDAIAVNTTAFIPAGNEVNAQEEDSSDPNNGNAVDTNTSHNRGKKNPLWRRMLGLSPKKAPYIEESANCTNGSGSSADLFTGSKTEIALLSWSESLGAPNYTQLRDNDIESYVQVWPFSSERKSMSTLVRIRRREDNKVVWRLYVKGAPEVIAQHCKWIVDIDGAFQMQDRNEIMNSNDTPSSWINENGGDDEGSVNSDTPDSADVPLVRVDSAPADSINSTGENSEKQNLSTNAPYLLSANYMGSQNIGSDTTDVVSEAPSDHIFPDDFAHNPAVPVLPLDEETMRDLRRTISDFASRALRTIGVAYRDFNTFDEARLIQQETDTEWREESGLVCLGVFGIEDPLREGVTDAVRKCQNAGIIVRMVTGDNVLTARAIATQCGIYTPGMGGIVLEGPKFRRLNPQQMEVIVPRLQVLARSSPEDKRMLVEWLRTHGEVVSVTGDGTNDGPALKAANVGFSMGIAGTEVAKEASSIVVMDDNFKSIVQACMWGRAVNDAVKKFLQFQITVNVTAVLIAFISAIVDKEEKSVFTAVQLLWINLIMDTFAALALATDPPSLNLLDRYPEKHGAPLITFTMWKHIIGQSIFQVVVCFLTLYAADDIFNLHTVTDAHDMDILRTLVFNTFAWMQIFNEFNCRVLHNELNCFQGIQKNMFFIGIALVSIVGQIIIIEWGGAAFQTTSLGGKYWAFSIIGGFISLPIGLILRLVPDELIWWLMPFIPQDIYRQPPSLEWQPPAQNVRERLIAANGGNSSDEDDKAAQFNQDPDKKGRSRKGRRFAGFRRSFDNSAESQNDQETTPPPKYSDAIRQRNSQIVVSGEGQRTPEIVEAPPATTPQQSSTQQQQPLASVSEQRNSKKRSGLGRTTPQKNVFAAAMVPSIVASSIGIGMSTSAPPPKSMTFADLVDQELERNLDAENKAKDKKTSDK